MVVEVRITIPDNVLAALGETLEKTVLRALLTRLIIRRLSEEEFQPEPETDEELRAVLELDERIKEVLWRKFYSQR